jgi:hypothetical protein
LKIRTSSLAYRVSPFASLKSYGWKYCSLICCERKTLFRLKKQAKKYRL